MRVEKITIKHTLDEQPDLSYLGEYSNTPGEHCIDRQERGDMDRGEYRYFNLGCGDPEYLEQDYARMKACDDGLWCMLGIVAEAQVSYSIGNGSKRLETLTSDGLWGVESDSDKELDVIDQEELDDLRECLKQFGIVCSDERWAELCEEAKNDIVED